MAEDSLIPPIRELISCLDALALGKTRFFTGEPCKYGHIDERIVSNGRCIVCSRESDRRRRAKNPAKNYAQVKAWRQANPEKRAEQSRRYEAKHPETREKSIAKYRASHADEIRETDRIAQARWRKQNPEKQRERMRRFHERAETEKERLAGRARPTNCDLCGDAAIGQICFDHCHNSGKFRGWICDRCNKVLGLIKDSRELLLKMAAYLLSIA